MIENALHRTERSTHIVLHLNSMTSYPNGTDPDFEWLWRQPRLLVNCVRVPVRREHASILHSMGANVVWAYARGVLPDYVVFQASNMWWVRPGMEQYVTVMHQSVPVITAPWMCKHFNGNRGRHSYQTCADIRHLEDAACDADQIGRPCVLPPDIDVDYLLRKASMRAPFFSAVRQPSQPFGVPWRCHAAVPTAHASADGRRSCG